MVGERRNIAYVSEVIIGRAVLTHKSATTYLGPRTTSESSKKKRRRKEKGKQGRLNLRLTSQNTERLDPLKRLDVPARIAFTLTFNEGPGARAANAEAIMFPFPRLV